MLLADATGIRHDTEDRWRAEGHSAETFRGHIDDALQALLPAILPGQVPIGILALHPRLGSVPERLTMAVMSGAAP